MASTATSFSGVSLGLSQSVRTKCCNTNALFAHPLQLSLAKTKSVRSLKSLQLYRSGAFPNGFQRFCRTSRPLVVRCEASNGRVIFFFPLNLQKLFFFVGVLGCGNNSIEMTVVLVYWLGHFLSVDLFSYNRCEWENMDVTYIIGWFGSHPFNFVFNKNNFWHAYF